MRGASPLDPLAPPRFPTPLRETPGRRRATRQRRAFTRLNGECVRSSVTAVAVVLALVLALALAAGLSLGCVTRVGPSIPTLSVAPPQLAEISLDPELGQAPTVILHTDAEVAPARVLQICDLIRVKLTLPCVTSTGPTAAIFDSSSGSIDARQSVEQLRETRTTRATIVMGVTMRPLELRAEGRVFGYASLTDATAIISLSGWGEHASSSDAALSHLVLHELGHALGLSHRSDRACVLREDRHHLALADAPDDYCLAERAELQAAIESAQRAGWAGSVRVRGHLARRAYAMAQAEALAAMTAPMHPTVVAEIAVMLSRAMMPDLAITFLHQIPTYAANSPDLLVDLARSTAPALKNPRGRCELMALMRLAQQRAPKHRGLRRALRRLSRTSWDRCPLVEDNPQS